jgi:hypothetical protein
VIYPWPLVVGGGVGCIGQTDQLVMHEQNYFHLLLLSPVEMNSGRSLTERIVIEGRIEYH